MLTTTNYGLKKPEGTDVVNVQNFNDNADIIDTKLKELYNSVSYLTYQTAGGTATAITLSLPTLINGYSKTFIASANNSGAATTINGKPLYRPGTTTAPNLIAGKAYTAWYDSGKSCFFIKASAEGDAVAANVLAGKKFSNDNDTGLVGTLDLSNLVSGNIRSGVTINGVSGKSSVVDTADANAAAGQILNGQTSYVNGSKITGTVPNYSGQTKSYSTLTDSNGNIGTNMISVNEATGGDLATHVVFKPNAGYYDGNTQIDLRVWGINSADVKAGAPIGYTNNSLKGTFTSDATANAGQILNGQTAYVNGNKITGNIPIRNSGNDLHQIYIGANGTNLFLEPPTGNYFNGASVYASYGEVANAVGLTSDKLVSGQNILGINGSATVKSLGGKKFATGTAVKGDTDYSFKTSQQLGGGGARTISAALTFKPSLIYVYCTDGINHVLYNSDRPDIQICGWGYQFDSDFMEILTADSPISVTDTGFTLLVFYANSLYNTNFKWYAFG